MWTHRIQYHLPRTHIDDEKKPDYFYACHAEKQLIAYLLSKHVFCQTKSVGALRLMKQPGTQMTTGRSLCNFFLKYSRFCLPNALLYLSVR
jgi:hypothetical protein